jgi:hypothetical protein
MLDYSAGKLFHHKAEGLGSETFDLRNCKCSLATYPGPVRMNSVLWDGILFHVIWSKTFFSLKT